MSTDKTAGHYVIVTRGIAHTISFEPPMVMTHPDDAEVTQFATRDEMKEHFRKKHPERYAEKFPDEIVIVVN